MTLLSLMQAAVKLYQRTLSPDHGLRRSVACRFEPTCSAYFLAATSIHGHAGLLLSLKRLLRCHPFARGGQDPVPPPASRP